MISMEISVLIAAVSVAAAVFFGVATYKRNKTADTKADATEIATIMVELKNIYATVTEIKTEISYVRSDVMEMRERMAKVESSSASAHRRLDTLEGRTRKED